MSAGRRIAGHPVWTNPRPSARPESLATMLRGLDVVYYVRRRGAVKIGHTSDLPERLRKLGCKWSDVVAVELGGRELEQQRHQQFSALRVRARGYGIEHYRISEPLISHVNQTMRDTIATLRGRIA